MRSNTQVNETCVSADLVNTSFSKVTRILAMALTGLASLTPASALAEKPTMQKNQFSTKTTEFDAKKGFDAGVCKVDEQDPWSGVVTLPSISSATPESTRREVLPLPGSNSPDLFNRNSIQLRYFNMETAHWGNRPEVQASIERAGMRLQPLGSCDSRVERDYYSVTIDELPDWFDPNEFVKKEAADMNRAIKNPAFDFNAKFRRQSDNPEAQLGDIINIDFPSIPFGKIDGPIVIEDIQSGRFGVETLGDRIDERSRADHPVAGRRIWGHERNFNGKQEIYTQGLYQHCHVPWFPDSLISVGQGMTWNDWANGVKDLIQPWAPVDENLMRFDRE